MRGSAVLLLVSVFLTPVVHAQSASKEPPLAIAAGDAQLKWGPCPDFMPKGCEIAVLHGDPARANADVFFKVPAGVDVAHHWHTSAERMVLISGEMRVTYDGHKPATLKPGMYAYGPSRLGHKVSCVSRDACVLFIAFESPVDALKTDQNAG
jgi:mannose-6-phosphate isomerase-like protein (cupin superfamily)